MLTVIFFENEANGELSLIRMKIQNRKNAGNTVKKNKSIVYIVITMLIGSIGYGYSKIFEQSNEIVVLCQVDIITSAVILAFVIQWLAFIPSYICQSEKYFDLVGSLTYLTLMLLCLSVKGQLDLQQYIILSCVVIWAVRLGIFLFIRVKRSGGDSRFDEIKTNFFRFFMVWNIQGLWVLVTLAAALLSITNKAKVLSSLEMTVFVIGMFLWLAGFSIEVVADWQKSVFRSKKENKKDFITSGLWAWSRHPNYFGEILLWIGIAVMSSVYFEGWQWLAWISPVFVYLLLTKVSGLPMLEAKAQKQWGNDPNYQTYRNNTPALMLRRPKN